MPAAVPEVFVAKLGIELAGVQMIDAPIPPVFAHRGVPLGDELLRQRMSSIATLGIDKGQELAGREISGMHGHAIKEAYPRYRIAKRRELFGLAHGIIHPESVSPDNYQS